MQLGVHRGQGQRNSSGKFGGTSFSVPPSSFPYGAAALPTGMYWDWDESGVKQITGSPLSYSITTVPTITGTTRTVANASEWVTKEALSVAGDALQITADFSISATLFCTKVLSSGFIRVISDRLSQLDTDVPYSANYMTCTSANRIADSDTSCYRTITITGASTSPIISFLQSAAGYWFTGVKLVRGSTNCNEGIFDIGAATMTQVSHMPNRIVVERCILDAAEFCKRGLNYNGSNCAIFGNLIINATSSPQGFTDSQAIASWRGGEKALIFNNALSGESEVIALGGTGGAISISGFIPGTDIFIGRNYVYKPAAWNSDASYALKKNMFETKQTDRAVVFGNIFDNYKSSSGGQFHQFVLKAESDSGNTWIYVHDLIIAGNLCINGDEGGPFQINPQGSNSNPHLGMARVTLVHNYFGHGSNDSASDIPFGSDSGNFGIEDFWMERNTLPLREAWFVTPTANQGQNAWPRLRIANNASWKAAQFGPVFASNGVNQFVTDAMFNVGYEFKNNAQVSGSSSWADGTGSLLASPFNCIENTAANMFTDPGTGDYTAKVGGPLKGTADDGGDIGSDGDWIINTLTAGVQ